MRERLTNQQQRDLGQALTTIKGIIGVEYPEVNDPGSENESEQAFRWGIGDGFRLALDALVESALPGWGSIVVGDRKDRR